MKNRSFFIHEVLCRLSKERLKHQLMQIFRGNPPHNFTEPQKGLVTK